MAQIYTIQASDAPQHTGKLQTILQNLQSQNRIRSFVNTEADSDLSSITDAVKEGDLILIVLTHQLDPQREQIETELKDLKTARPEIRIGEIIVDKVPYENEFITFPADLRDIRSREDMDEAWGSIEQSLKDMFPAEKEPDPVSPFDWPKYLKIGGVIIGVILALLLIRSLMDRENGGGVEEADAVVEEAEPVPESSSVNLDFTELGNSRLLDRRITALFNRQGIRDVQVSSSGNYCSDARPAILAAGTYRAPVSFLSTARPGALNSCNGVPLEFEFSTPVREVTIQFYGAAANYLLTPYNENGRRLGSSSAQGSPYNYEQPFSVTYTSESANISRITFGHQTALTMVLNLTATR